MKEAGSRKRLRESLRLQPPSPNSRLLVVPMCLVTILLVSINWTGAHQVNFGDALDSQQKASLLVSLDNTLSDRANRALLDSSVARRHLGSARERVAQADQVNNAWPTTKSANELAFSNQTGAVIQCTVARELRRLMAGADLAATRRQRAQVNVTPILAQPDVRIKWLKESGEELESSVYAAPEVHAHPSASDDQQPAASNGGRLIRFIRATDGALVFEPFRATDFRPDVHLATYRCVASCPARGASLLGAEVRVKGELTPPTSPQIEVLDEMVLEGNSAQFKCHLAGRAREQFFVLDWLESIASGSEILHSFQSTTQAYLQRPPVANSSIARHFFIDQSNGNLHIIGVDLSLNYHSFSCRCKSRLTGELLVSNNRGQLIVTESRTPVAPHLTSESPQLLATHEEGELALLACPVQSQPRPQFTWFRRQAGDLRPIRASEGASQQVGALLLLRRVSRNDSGTYVCLAKNEAGEQRAELELTVRARLRARLTSSATVLERGKSIALDCSVSGYPINQLVFVHNQNVIKSVGAESMAAALEGSGQTRVDLASYRAQANRPHQAGQAGQVANYFVVDETRLEASEQLAADRQKTDEPADWLFEYLSSPDTAEAPASGAASSQQQPGNLSSLAAAKQQTQLSHVIVIVLEPQHAGAYQCFASNQYESVQSSAYIRVLEDPPKFKDTFRSGVYERGQDITLLCSAGANPLPEIRWSVDEQPMPETEIGHIRLGDYVTKDDLLMSFVNISQAQVTDGGLYRCTADNGLAQVSHQALVSVIGEPVVKQMANQTVVAGTALQARCPVAGYPLLEVHWAHNGRRLPANHRQRVLANGSLLVEHMEKAQGDQGEYSCTVRSPTGETARGSFQVSIKARPSIEPFSLGRSLREGQRASIMCTISSGDLPISISWFQNELPIPGGGDGGDGGGSGGTSNDNSAEQASAEQQAALRGVRVSRVSDYSSTLLFESLLAEHTANYTCVARNDAGQVSHQAPMIVQVAPKWTVEPADTSVVRGGSASVHCAASGFPAPRITWTKASDGQSHRSGGNLLQPGSWVFESGALNILDARDSDHGLYMCQASNGVGPGLSKVVRVTINVAAQFGSRHTVQYATRADSTQLKCQAKGDWPIQIRWLKNKARLEPINVRESPGAGAGAPARQTSVASILLVPINDSWALADQHKSTGLLMQRYTLTNSESVLAANRAATVADQTEVQSAPTSSNELQTSPLASVEQPAGSPAPLVVQLTSTLTVSQLERQDTGTFKCLASNSFGQDERVIQLIVQEQPDRIDELTALEAASRSITLAWLAPYDGQAPLLAYHIQYRPEMAPATGSKQHLRSSAADNPAALDWFNYTLPVGDGAPYNTAGGQRAEAAKDEQPLVQQGSVDIARHQLALPPSSERPLVKFTLSNLRPMTSYWFQVQAENKLGRGPISNSLQANTLEEAPGSAPSKLKAVAQSSSSILVSWSKLSDKEIFGTVHGYYVAYKPVVDSTPNVTVAEPQQQQQQQQQHTNIYKTIQHDDKLTKFDALLSGLKRSTKYVISVQAFNARGTGPSTDPVQVRTLDTDPPKQVKLFVKQATNCSIQLEWRPLSQAALKVLKSKESLPGSTEMPVDMNGHQLPVALPLSAPPAPQVAQMDMASNVPADQVDYYNFYQAELTEQPQWRETRLPGYASSHTLDNLRCGTRYQFYMLGVNKIGVGDQSDILDTKTTGGVPLAPARHLMLDVINTTCYTVRLDRWHDNGCSIRGFTVRYKAETSRDWIQLASIDTATMMQDPTTSVNQPIQPEVLSAWPSKRNRRSAISDEGFYLAAPSTLEDDSMPDDDAFMDYATDFASDYNSAARFETESESPNRSQLLDLLNDSMLSSFETFAGGQNQVSNLRSSLFTTDLGESNTSEQQTATSNKQQVDSRRVKLCNLIENTYYWVRVSAENIVGQADAEIRLLTSQDGLEFDPDTKRHVIGRLGGSNAGRSAQSVLATGDKLSLLTFAGLQWPILIPITLLVALTTVIVAVMLLLRRSSSSSSSTSTTLSNHHCSAASSYAHDSPPSHQNINVEAMIRASIDPRSDDIDVFNEGHSSSNGPTLKSSLVSGAHLHETAYGSPSVAVYGQHQQRLGTCQVSHAVDETHYGLAAPHSSVTSYPVSSYLLGSDLPVGANQASSSPATTTATLSASGHSTSTGSGGASSSGAGTGGGSSVATGNGVFIRAAAADFGGHHHQQQPGQQQASIGQNGAQRGGRVYLCTKPTDMLADEQVKADGSTYYGVDEQTNELGLIYGPTIAQLRQIQQQSGALQKADAEMTTAQVGKLDNNCFLTIVEEVARASEAYQSHPTSKSYGTVEVKSNGQNCEHHVVDCTSSAMNQFDQQCQLATNFAANSTFEHERGPDLHQTDAELSNRLIFDPVYSTIRRNFPQAFRYLTLQQPGAASAEAHSKGSGNKFIAQRNPLPGDTNLNSLMPFSSDYHSHQQSQQQQQQQQQAQVSYDMSLFNSNNLAALNLLTTNNPASNGNQMQRQRQIDANDNNQARSD